MMCWGRKLKRDQTTQTNISYVHWMRLVEYDTNLNEGPRIVQWDREPRKGSESSGARRSDSRHLPSTQTDNLQEHIGVGPFGVSP